MGSWLNWLLKYNLIKYNLLLYTRENLHEFKFSATGVEMKLSI